MNNAVKNGKGNISMDTTTAVPTGILVSFITAVVRCFTSGLQALQSNVQGARKCAQETLLSRIVDSGASDHYVDSELIPGLRYVVKDYIELQIHREITTAGKYTLHEKATGTLHVLIKNSNGKSERASLKVTIVPGTMFSSVAA